MPRLLTPRRLTTLVASLFAALGAGTNYAYSGWAPQLGKRLAINHTQLNIIGLAGNIGVYSTAPVWGRVADTRGPRVLLVIACVGLLVGYTGIRAIFQAGLPSPSDADPSPSLADSHFVLLALCAFLSGVGGNGGLAAALNVTAKSFPDRARASATGLVISGFGLSAFFFSTLAHALFPGDTPAFLLTLAIGTSVPMFVGYFLVRPVPHGEDGIKEFESGVHADDEDDDGAAGVYRPGATRNDSRTPLLSADPDPEPEAETEDVEVHGRSSLTRTHHTDESSHYAWPHERDSLELSPPRAESGVREQGERSVSRASRKAVEADVVSTNIHGWALARDADFWVLFCFMSLLSGTGLMYINNVGSISQALYAQNPDNHPGDGYDEVQAAAWQAMQVSTVSVANCAGRILIGLTADYTKNTLRLQRSACLTLVAALFLVSQVACLAVSDVSDLWKASALLGLAYGGMFGLIPTISIEWFGLPHFSENWGFLSLSPLFGGNLFSLAFGRNLDAHAAPPAESDTLPSAARLLQRATEGMGSVFGKRGGVGSDRECFAGRACYAASLQMTVVACALALGLAVYAGARDRRKRGRR